MVQRRRTRAAYGRTKYAEDDVFTKWRHQYRYTQRAGVCAKIKRGARRRERREAKVSIRVELAER